MMISAYRHKNGLTLAPASVVIDTLNAARVGSTDDAILRFDGTPTTVGTAITPTTTAANGTIFAITEPGMYRAEIIGQNGETAGCAYGVSKNSTLLTSLPTVLDAGIIEAAQVDMAGGDIAVIKLAVAFFVTQAEASAAGGALIRFHATDLAGASPSALVVGTVRARITRINGYLG